MRIKHVSGKYWNEDNGCFGPIQSATEYEYANDLPLHIDYGLLEYNSGYYYDSSADAVASVQS